MHTAQNEVILVLLSFSVSEHSDFRFIDVLLNSVSLAPWFPITVICVRHNTFKDHFPVQNLPGLS